MKTNLHIFRIPLLLLLIVAACTKEKTPSLSIDGKTAYTLESGSVRLNIKLIANSADWTCDTGADWISLLSREAAQATLLVAENPGFDAREATVSFRAGQASALVAVTQAGKARTPFVEVSVTGNGDVDAAGATLTATVSSWPEEWEPEITSGSEILTIAKEEHTLKITVLPNTEDKPRSGRIRVWAPSKAAGLAFQDIAISQKPLDITYQETDLSETATSNCYLISHKGPYSFNAKVRGNGKTVTGLSAPTALSPAGAKLVWQSAKGMISAVSYADGVIHFTAERINGNALIAATDASGNIIWSWHIWYPADEPSELSAATGDKVMSMNLGAMTGETGTLGSYGLLYQWGRKDPFPGSPVMHGGSVYTPNAPVYDMNGATVKIEASNMYSTTANTLAYSIAHPETCLSNNYQYASCRDWLTPSESNDALWGNPGGNTRNSSGTYTQTGSKTYYDPCPAGWRVPALRTFQGFTPTGGYCWTLSEFNVVDVNGDGDITLDDWSDGWQIYLDKKNNVSSYFPATTRYDGQYAMLMGSMVGLWGNYWYNTPGENTDTLVPYGARAVSFSIKDYNGTDLVTMSALSTGSRADAYAVRCIKE